MEWVEDLEDYERERGRRRRHTYVLRYVGGPALTLSTNNAPIGSRLHINHIGSIFPVTC